MQSKEHWEKVYTTRETTDVSWFQEHAERSLKLIRGTGVPPSGAIIDVGGGASRLVDDLLGAGYRNITVLDISAAALQATRRRLGSRADQIHWIEASVLEATLPEQAYDIWHDRAVFHFLTDSADRRRYVDAVMRAVKPGGFVIVASFGEGGPTECSGLPVVRYSADTLHDQFGNAFDLLAHEVELHTTPKGTTQEFVYCLCRKAAT